MFKILIGTMLFLSMQTFQSHAQEKAIGVKAGLQRSNITSRNYFIAKSTPGFHLGVILKKPVLDNSILQYELLYSRKGFEQTLKIPPYNATGMTAQLDYIEGNSLIKFKLYRRLYAYPGIQFSLLVRNYAEVTDVNLNNFSYDNPNTGEVSWIGGIGYKLNDHWRIDLRYTKGSIGFQSTAPKNKVISLGMEYFL